MEKQMETLENTLDKNINNDCKNDLNIDTNVDTQDNIDFTSQDCTDSDNEETESNCLALTIRQDYSVSIFKNGLLTTGRLSLKVILSTIFLNILRLFF